MAVEIWDGWLGRIYLWDILIAWKPVTPPEEKYVATISWTENCNWDFNPTYGWDAASWIKWSNCFDKLFWYSAVLLDWSGNVIKEVTQEDSWGWWCLNINCLWTISWWCNVMIKFPRMGYCLSKNWSTITLWLTRCADKTWYCYYAFNRNWPTDGRYCATYTQPYMYLGTYLSTNSSNVEKSWSWCTPDYCKNIDTFRNYSMANGSNYQQLWHWQRSLINLYYLAKYGCWNSQAAVWCWYVNWSCRVSTWWTNTQTSATYWTQSWTQQMKLFWLEDWRGNEYQWVDGIYWKYVETSNNPACICARSTSWTWADTWVGVWSGWWISSIAGNNLWMTMPSVYSGSNSTYYSDYGYVYASCVAYAGGAWDYSCTAGAFYLYVSNSPSYAAAYVGSRLMYL